MFRHNLFAELGRKMAGFEILFRQAMELRTEWTAARPKESGYFYVRQILSPAITHLHCYSVVEGEPFRVAGIHNQPALPGKLEFLGPFGVDEFIEFAAGRIRLDKMRAARELALQENYKMMVEPGQIMWPVPEGEEGKVLAQGECLDCSVGTCEICETPIFESDEYHTDAEGICWHKGCDGEVRCDDN